MFITLEGIEGSGKSRLSQAIADHFTYKGTTVLQTREPGAGELGKKIRELLLDGVHIEPLAEVFLFLADRAQHVSTIVRPALTSGSLVICDRFADSTLVYQGYARGYDIEWLRGLNGVATEWLVPDLTLLLDLDPVLGLERQTKRDRLDSEPMEFHEKVRNGFLDEAKKDEARWHVIDASKIFDDVLKEALSVIEKHLRRSA